MKLCSIVLWNCFKGPTSVLSSILSLGCQLKGEVFLIIFISKPISPSCLFLLVLLAPGPISFAPIEGVDLSEDQLGILSVQTKQVLFGEAMHLTTEDTT